jgi:hypothetical protein
MTNRGLGIKKAALAILLLALTMLALPAAADDGVFSWQGLWARVVALFGGGEANAETPPGDDAEFISHPPVGG